MHRGPRSASAEQYWLVADPGNAATWDAWPMNSIGDSGPHAVSQGGAPFTDESNTRGAFEIFASPVTVPEPSSFALLAFGGGAVAGWRRWRKKA
jgi:hypothetical protein